MNIVKESVSGCYIEIHKILRAYCTKIQNTNPVHFVSGSRKKNVNIPFIIIILLFRVRFCSLLSTVSVT